MLPVETNIVIFEAYSSEWADKFIAHLKSNQILCGRISPESIRFVFHLDISEEGMQRIEKAIDTFTA